MQQRDRVTSIARRDVLKLAGGFLAARAARPAGKAAKKIIVAGGGISGLCCAYELMKRGHDVTLLEALGRPGGHILTIRDHLADGLYADAGAEHFYQRGYDEFWRYLQEFDLPVVEYPRRDSMIRFIHGRPYTEERLADRTVLKKLELSQREIEYLVRRPWPDFLTLYLVPYLDSFPSEDRPFEAGLNHLDQLTMTDLLRKDGASPAAIGLLGSSRSALHTVWQAAIKKLRGFEQYVRHVNRIQGGNQRIAEAFASRLGSRLRLGCPLTGIRHGDSGVTVEHKEFGRIKKLEADYLVLAMSFRSLREISVTPPWPATKRYVIDNTQYDLKARVIFQSRSRFWKSDGLSPNITFSDTELTDVWEMAEEVRTSRGLLIGQARTSSIDASLAKFRQLYPGKSEDIEQALIVNWTLDPWAGSCLPLLRSPGDLARFWPEVARPHGRIHFASVGTDCLPNGLEAGVRSAKRAAEAIHQA